MNAEEVGLWTPLEHEGLKLKNRLVALPVFSGYALPNGSASSLLIERYARLARSGVGLVVVANAAVSADGLAAANNLRLDRDEFIPGLARLARAIRRQGALACLQLNHAGRLARTERPLLPSALGAAHAAFDVSSLKAFMEFFPLEARFGLTADLLRQMLGWRRAMSGADIERVVRDFGQAAGRAAAAGFEAVELHGASGYLLTQFLSAYTNRREDEFGGDFPGRAALVLAVLREVRANLPAGFPVGFRLTVREFTPAGVGLSEALALARLLEQAGAAYLSATLGSHNSLFFPDVRQETGRPGYLRAETAALKAEVRVPIIISGRIITPKLARQILAEAQADLIGLGRPLLADPDWPRKALAGQEIRACRDCHRCLKRVILGRGLACALWPEKERERVDLEHKFLGRGLFRGLWIVSGDRDAALLRAALPVFIPARHGLSDTVLFLKGRNQPPELTSAEEDFLSWGRAMVQGRGFVHQGFDHLSLKAEIPRDRAVARVAQAGGYGAILMGFNLEETWRERVVYKESGRIVGLLGDHPRPGRVLVALDLSPVSLLVLRSVSHFLLGKPGFDLTFAHVLEGPAQPAERRWARFRDILGWSEDFYLRLLARSGSVAATLLEEVDRGGFGAVVMGKRGLSGIKRLILGSVSREVMRGLKGQSLFLVD